MKTFRKIILLPAVSLLLVATVALAGQSGQIRADLDAILADDQRIDAATGNAFAETLVAARERLAALTDEELEALVPYAVSIANLKEKVALLATHVTAIAEAAKAERQARSAGFPDAEYYTDSLCTGIRNDTAGMKIAWNVYWAAETTMLAAKFACEQDILGTNTAAVCIPFAVALGVAKQVIENFDFCDDDVDSSEIGASYLRIGHLHDDMALIQEALDQAEIALIQMDLARPRFNVAEFVLPAAFNGKLEFVRAVVLDVLARLAAENMDIRNAHSHVALADEYYAVGDWKGTFKQLGYAYREAVRLP
jgi:hypothetical protein